MIQAFNSFSHWRIVKNKCFLTPCKEFAAKNPDFVAKFAKATLAQDQRYQINSTQFRENSDNLDKIASVTGAKIDDIKVLLTGDSSPVANEQAALLGGSVSKAIDDTAAFLFALVGLGCANFIPILFKTAAQTHPRTAGEGIAYVSRISYFGFLIGPVAIGIFASEYGLSFAFISIACCAILIAKLANFVLSSGSEDVS